MLNVSMFECINAQWPSVRLVHSRKRKEWRVKTCVLSLTVTIKSNVKAQQKFGSPKRKSS